MDGIMGGREAANKRWGGACGEQGGHEAGVQAGRHTRMTLSSVGRVGGCVLAGVGQGSVGG